MRTRHLISAVLISLLVCLAASNRALAADAPDARPKKIVLLAGKKSHGPDGNGLHDYAWSVRLLKVMLERSNIKDRIHVAYHLDGWPNDPTIFDGADTIVVISDGRDGDQFSEALHLESDQRVAFVDGLMKRGCGLVTFHFSTFAPQKYADKVLDWTGGYFQWETDGKRQWYSNITTTEADVTPLSPEHPVSRGVKPFRMKEEFYFNLRFRPDADPVTPILEAKALNGREPDGNVVAWARQRPGGGRGFGTTCGHFYDNWQHDEFSKMMLNAVAWTAHVEVPPGGVEAKYYTRDEIRATLDEFRKPGPADPLPKTASNVDWPRSLGDAGSTRFSSLTQINRENVKDLEVAWVYHSKDAPGNIQCNPIIVDGIMYAPTPGNHVVAVNAENGKEIWRFKCDGRPAHRGLLYWKGDEQNPPRILFVAGRKLHALDPKTGTPIKEFGDGGKIALPDTATAGPATFKHVIVIPLFFKDVEGYDLITGRKLWTFHTVPHPGEFGYETWDPESYQTASSANCWGGMAMDEKRGIAYIATGSPKPNFNGTDHHGRNLFGNCVIALEAETGKRLWHFQEIRHDIWDLDIPAPPNLVTVTSEGRRVDAVAQVTKIGNTLLLDRETGRPLFPFLTKPAPPSKLPGEIAWPEQPAIELPEPFSRQTFSLADVTDLSPESHGYIMEKLKNARMGWFEPFEEGRPTALYGIHGGAEWTGAAVDPQAGLLYVSANELPWIITVRKIGEVPRKVGANTALPDTPGAKLFVEQGCVKCHGENRQGLSWYPPLLGVARRLNDAQVEELLKTGRKDMPSFAHLTPGQRKQIIDFVFDRDHPPAKAEAGVEMRPDYSFDGYVKLLDQDKYPGCKPPWGTLNCIDLNTGKLVWKVPLGEYDELTRKGIPKTGTENFGGAICTAGGLVFCGGTRDIKLRAFDRATGKELWQHPLPFGGFAPPSTYMVNGRQYVVIPATGGGKLDAPVGDAYVAFALKEGAASPEARANAGSQ